MNQNHIALIVGAVIAAVNNLEKNMHLLDSVTSVEDRAQAMNSHIANEHKGVVARLDVIVSKLRSAQHGSIENLQMDTYQMFSIFKAVNENIGELEKAQSYFCQMGNTEQLVASFQEKIAGLHFAMFEFNKIQNS